MSAQATENQSFGQYNSDGKVLYLLTGGGRISCLRCTASSTRTKNQCGRPALKTSTTQKCQFHGGRPHSSAVLQRISEANVLHGQSTKESKKKYRQDSIFILQLEEAIHILKMGTGPKFRGRKPDGFKSILTKEDVLRVLLERALHTI